EQVIEFAPILAGCQIGRHVRPGGRIKMGMKRTAQQLRKRRIRKTSGAAEHHVFQDVGHAGGTCQRRTEGDAETTIGITVLDDQDVRARRFVTQSADRGTNLRSLCLTVQLKWPHGASHLSQEAQAPAAACGTSVLSRGSRRKGGVTRSGGSSRFCPDSCRASRKLA